MWIIGCDFHPRYQQVYGVDRETGEVIERRLTHEGPEVEKFYRELPAGAVVGMEATGPARWFERLLENCGHRLWVGDAARIRASEVRKQKTDSRDARRLYELLEMGKFPRIWVPTSSQRDTRQLLWHRHKLVQWRTQVQNQLRALARNEGWLSRGSLQSQERRRQIEELALDPWARQRRQDLLRLLDELHGRIAELTREVEQEAQRRPDVVWLMQEPGVGPIVGLAFVLTLGPVERFRRSRCVVSYLGLNPSEASSGEHRRLGSISKQGNRMMRWLLVEAAWIATRKDAETPLDSGKSLGRQAMDFPVR
jgi:transposase